MRPAVRATRQALAERSRSSAPSTRRCSAPGLPSPNAIKERRTDLEIRTWLGRDARTWVESGRGQTPLTGGRLNVAGDWAERHPAELSPEMAAYLRAAVNQVRRRRALTIAVPILLVVALVVGGLAIQAVNEAGRANAARAEADALRLVGEARLAFETRPDLGYLLAMEAAARSDDLQIQAAPLIGLVRGPGPRRYESVGTPIEKGRLDRGGTRAILATAGGLVLWDVAAGRAVATLPHTGETVAISGDGSTVAFDDHGRIVIAGWPSGQPMRTCDVTANPVGITKLGLSENGTVVAVAWDDAANQPESRVAVVDPADCHRVPLQGIASHVQALDLSPSGDRIAVAVDDSEEGGLVWDASSGEQWPDAPSENLNALRFGANGRLAGLTPNGELIFWDANDFSQESQRFRLGDGGNSGAAVALSPTDEVLAAVSGDGQLRAVRTNQEDAIGPALKALASLDYGGVVTPLDVATDGSRAVTIDPSGRIIEWDLDGRTPLGSRIEQAGFRVGRRAVGGRFGADREHERCRAPGARRARHIRLPERDSDRHRREWQRLGLRAWVGRGVRDSRGRRQATTGRQARGPVGDRARPTAWSSLGRDHERLRGNDRRGRHRRIGPTGPDDGDTGQYRRRG